MINQAITAARVRLGISDTIQPERHQNLLDMFRSAVASYPDRPAYTCLGHTISFRELDQLSSRFAAYLQGRPELRPGDRIAIQLPNTLQYPVVLFGALRAGLVVVNTNPLYSPTEMEHQLNDAGVAALVVVANVAHTAAKVLDRTGVKLVIVTELADLHPPLKRVAINFAVRYIKRMVPAFSIPGAVSFTAAMRAGRGHELRPVNPGPEDLAILQYTGGTTGVAKGAMLSHRNLVANTLQGEAMFSTYGIQTGSELFVLPLPLYHIYTFILSMIMLTTANHCLLIPNPRDIDGLIKEMKRYPFTGICGLNTLFVALCARDEFAQIDFSRLKATLSGGMALTTGAAQNWKRITGSDIYEGYGLTETSPVVSVNPGNDNQLGTIGIAVPSTQIKIADDDGVEHGLNEPGELCVKGPQVMQGYWQRPDETSKVLDDEGWLRTGDIAIVRDDGYMKIVDRKKDVIVVSGFKVFPGEVEDVVSRHPDVLECAAVGVPDEHSGEAVQVFAVLRKPGLTEQALRDFCHEHLTGYKVPKHVEFRKELPKSNIGKVLRRELRDEALKKHSGS